jgi:diguanylate cyclase (GGDEF)-like protein
MSDPKAKLSFHSGIRSLLSLSCRLLGLPSISNLETQLKEEKAKLQQMIKQQKALYRVISKIRASLDLENIFRTTTKETCKLLSVERVAVYRFYDDWGGEFVGDFEFAEAGWKDGEALGKNTVWMDSYLQQHQGGRYRDNETLVVSDIYQANLSQCHLDVLEQFYIRAYATAPIFIGQKLWGILAAYQHSQPREWDSSEVEFLAQVSAQLGFAVQQAELLAKTQQKAKDLHEAGEQQKILFNLIIEIRESLDLDTLFKTTTREVRKALGADRVGIFRFDVNTNYCCGEFVSESVLPGYDSAIEIKIYDRCFENQYTEHYCKGQMQILGDIYSVGLKECYLAMLEQFQIKAQVIIPLMNGKTLWGLLCIHQCGHTREWTTSEVQFVKQLAAQFSVALTHADLLAQTRSQAEQLTQTLNALQHANLQLEELARLDALTQIPNRRHFDEVLNREWQRLRREGQTLSLILFDIDYFKLYNDSYGHQAGDRCLKDIAHAAQQVLKRSTDLLARYGGEEFSVILPNTEPVNAIEVAKQIQNAVRELAIPHPNASSGKPIVTVSLGIANQVPTMDKTPSDLLAEADQALYDAKNQGRDRWVFTANENDHPY